MAARMVSSERPAFCILITSLLFMPAAKQGSAATNRKNRRPGRERFMMKKRPWKAGANQAEDRPKRKGELFRWAERRRPTPFPGVVLRVDPNSRERSLPPRPIPSLAHAGHYRPYHSTSSAAP